MAQIKNNDLIEIGLKSLKARLLAVLCRGCKPYSLRQPEVKSDHPTKANFKRIIGITTDLPSGSRLYIDENKRIVVVLLLDRSFVEHLIGPGISWQLATAAFFFEVKFDFSRDLLRGAGSRGCFIAM